MPPKPSLAHAKLEGYIATIPLHKQESLRFEFDLVRLNGQSVRAKLMLSCYKNCPRLNAGHYYQLTAKLKKPHSFVNPGSFDTKNWLASKHITWQGYVDPLSFKRIGARRDYRYSILRFRAYMAKKMSDLNGDKASLGIWEALTLGLSQEMSEGIWDLFRRTGTIHLMVISGAHIGLVAGLNYTLGSFLWRFFVLKWVIRPAQQVGSFFAMGSATIYAILAGFGIPTQRALIAGMSLLLKNFLSYKLSPWQAYRLALFFVLSLEPHSIYFIGFYLSFLAVAILMSVSQRFKLSGFKGIMLLQLCCLAGLMPACIFIFGFCSISGFFANLVAIPFVGFWLVPLSLICLTLSSFNHVTYLISVLNTSSHLLLNYLTLIDKLSFLNLQFNFQTLETPLIILFSLVCLCLLPLKRFWPFCGLMILLSFYPHQQEIKEGTAIINVLDVGQGLSVLVRTRSHVLLYDTGMKFFSGRDMGELVISPYLFKLNITSLDKVVISHSDLDHRGGYLSIKKKFPIHELIVENPTFYHEGVGCHEYEDWQWDGVSFSFLAIEETFKDKNNHSCILKIETKTTGMLLPGDIEKEAEMYLVNHWGEKLKATYLLVPHHGSKTSSSLTFLQKVSPKLGIISAGFDNQFHFPHKQIIDRYQKLHIPLINTADRGLVTVRLQ